MVILSSKLLYLPDRQSVISLPASETEGINDISLVARAMRAVNDHTRGFGLKRGHTIPSEPSGHWQRLASLKLATDGARALAA
jgi:hypothetical protein